MNRRRLGAVEVLAAFLASLLLSGCGLFGVSKEEEKPPEQLMSEGLASLESGYYEAATEAFQKIKDRYPYSQFAVAAELKMADALYKRDLFEEAYEAYSEFEKLHPRNPEVPYAVFQMGMCHFRQVSTVDRDQTHTYLAKEEFERLVKKFPKSPYADKGRLKLRKCYIFMADHELYVGHFYFKKKNYRAAMNRYEYILKHYPDLGQYHEALEYLSKCKERIAEEKQGS